MQQGEITRQKKSIFLFSMRLCEFEKHCRYIKTSIRGNGKYLKSIAHFSGQSWKRLKDNWRILLCDASQA